MPQSTPLDQLGGVGPTSEPAAAPPADEERVKRILAEINAEGSITPPPPTGGYSSPPAVITEPPVSVSTGQLRMDPGTARAHVIGNSAPSLADFHTMFAQTNPTIAPYHGPVANPPGPAIPGNGAKERTDYRTMLMQWLRSPLVVGIIVFFLNMPIITETLSRYASWMYLSSGEISVPGLVVKGVLGAGLYAIYQGLASVF